MNRSMKVFYDTLRPAVLLGRYYRQRWNPRTTYADDGEDVAAAILLGEVVRFIDVGANDGLSGSNTLLAALQGARGLCFEPSPTTYLRLRGFYRWAGRIECIPVGLSDREGAVDFRCDGLLSAITITEDTALSQLLAQHRQADAPVTRIRVERLSTWLDRRPDFRACDLLSLDVEGHELSVLQGNDWVRHPKPGRLLIVETHANGAHQQWRHRDFDAIANLLAEQGYRKLAASRNNTFWLHRDDLSESRLIAAKNRFPQYTWFSP